MKDVCDWVVFRNRYWGIFILLWVSDDFEEVVCVGLVVEFEELLGVKILDFYRESVDYLIIFLCCGKGFLYCVFEVFDCWFESGSMFYV